MASNNEAGPYYNKMVRLIRHFEEIYPQDLRNLSRREELRLRTRGEKVTQHYRSSLDNYDEDDVKAGDMAYFDWYNRRYELWIMLYGG